MKKLCFIAFIILFTTGCEKTEKTNFNYSEISFTGIFWIRDNKNDIETIRFGNDGSYSYSCSCGNPVNDSDLCETYSYNEKTNEIKLDCFETTDDTITIIKVVNFTDKILELDFNGEIRKFEKRK